MTTDIPKTNNNSSYYPSDLKGVCTSIVAGVGAGVTNRLGCQALDILTKKTEVQPIQDVGQKIFHAMKEGNKKQMAKLGLLSILVAPALEEYVYRGELYSYQKELSSEANQSQTKSWKDIAKDIGINAALFTILHYERGMGIKRFLPLAAACFVSGVTYCVLTDVTGNIGSSTIAHGTENALTLRKIYQLAKK